MAPLPRTRVHAKDCRCADCHPRTDGRFAIDTAIGLAIGLSAAAAIDWVVNGPGILSIFGVGL